MNADVLQWLGCATGVVGSALLAWPSRWSGWGFVVYLLSNACWIGFGVLTHAPGLVVMQLIFIDKPASKKKLLLRGIFKRLFSTIQSGAPASPVTSSLTPGAFTALLTQPCAGFFFARPLWCSSVAQRAGRVHDGKNSRMSPIGSPEAIATCTIANSKRLRL